MPVPQASKNVIMITSESQDFWANQENPPNHGY